MEKNRLLILIIICLILVGCKEKEYTCIEGEYLDGICKIVELKEASITCPTGYEFDVEKGKCLSTMTIAAKTVNKCAKGYQMGNENWCISKEKYDIIETQVCESSKIKENDKLSTTYMTESNKCIEKICIKKSKDGKECLKYEENEIPIKTKKTCPEKGMSRWEGYCRKLSWLNITKSCEIGTLKGDKCIIENLVDASIICDEGFELLDGYKCQKTTYVEAVEK